MAVLRSKPSADVARYRCEVRWVSCLGECSRPTAFSRPSGDLVKRSAPASDTRARIFGRTCHSWARSREHVSLLSAETMRAPHTHTVARTRHACHIGRTCHSRARSWAHAHGPGCTRKPQAGRPVPAAGLRLAVAPAYPAPTAPALHWSTREYARLQEARWSSSPPLDRSVPSSILTA